MTLAPAQPSSWEDFHRAYPLVMSNHIPLMDYMKMYLPPDGRFGPEAYHHESYTCLHRIRTALRPSMPPVPPGRILDAGCSVGISTMELARLYPACTVVGIDRNIERIGLAKENMLQDLHQRVSFQLADFYNDDLLFGGEKYDAIFCMNSITFRVESLYKEAGLGRIAELLHTVTNNWARATQQGGFWLIAHELRHIMLRRDRLAGMNFHPDCVKYADSNHTAYELCLVIKALGLEDQAKAFL